MDISQEDIENTVQEIHVLLRTKQSDKVVSLIKSSLKKEFSDKDKHELLLGIYKGVNDSLKLNKSQKLKIDKSVISGTSFMFKVGYAIYIDLYNEDDDCLRILKVLYVSSNTRRRDNKLNWDISNHEDMFLDEFYDTFSDTKRRDSDTTSLFTDGDDSDDEKETNDTKEGTSEEKEENIEDDDIKSDDKLDEDSDLKIDFNNPQNVDEFIWPWVNIDNNPFNIEELEKLIELSGYDDEDLDTKSNAVFTTDRKYAVGFAKKADTGYLYLLKKQEHYWDPLLTDENKVLLLEYNFTNIFLDNVRELLSWAPQIFPLRMKK